MSQIDEVAATRRDETMDHVTAVDRLRLHVHDPDTFGFGLSDAADMEHEIERMEALLTLAQNWMALLVNKSATARDPGFAEALWKIEGYLLKSDAPFPPKAANPYTGRIKE